MSDPTAVLTAYDLSKRFGSRLLFQIPQLVLAKQQALYLQGDNGSGKTTLLKILAGLLRPTTGHVEQQGRLIYLHQTPYLFDGTVLENVCYGLRFIEPNTQQRIARAEEVLALSGLGSLSRQHSSTLSGGERQRVAIARAWVLRPAALLMDESVTGLDTHAVDSLMGLTQTLLNQGTSLIITSHQPTPLTSLCQRHCTLQGTTPSQPGRLIWHNHPG